MTCSHPSLLCSPPDPKKKQHTLYPGLLLQPGHHDYSCCSLFPHHPPEVTEGFWQRSLCGDVGVLLPIPIYVIGIDVITAWNPCRERERSVTPGAARDPVPITVQGLAGRGRGRHIHKALDKSPLQGDARISPRGSAKDRNGVPEPRRTLCNCLMNATSRQHQSRETAATPTQREIHSQEC